MAITSILNTALTGLRAGATSAAAAAHNIVNINTPGFKSTEVRTSTLVSGPNADGGSGVRVQLASGDSPDLAREVVNLALADTSYRANAALLRTAEDLARETLEIKA